MKIVFANKYWYLKRGAERYMLDLAALLESHRHSVIPFAMRSDKDLSSEWSRYFVSPVLTDKVRFDWQGLRTAGRTLYSFEARRKFGKLLDEARPDLVHVHNIYHQISPSIIPEAGRRGLPVVMTAHDYNLIAPNYALYHDGSVCERTKPDRYWQAVIHRCVNGSLAASALAAFEKTVQKLLRLYGALDRIIAPSRFVQGMLLAYGIDQSKVVHVPHFIDAAKVRPSYGGGYALFVGSLSPEKRVDVLIRAAARVPALRLRIVGAGPEERKLLQLAQGIGATNVVFAGFKAGEHLLAEYRGARFIAIQSSALETFGLTVLEAYASGKTAIVSRTGALPEVVRDGETALLASPASDEEWAEKMAQLWNDPGRCERMGRAGRAWAEKDFAPEQHYRRILEVYDAAKTAALATKVR